MSKAISPDATLLYEQRKRIRLAVSLFYFCQGLAFASWASRIPTIKTALNISEGQLGTILLMLPLGQLITMTLSGRLVTKFGSAKVLSIACILYAAVLYFLAFADSALALGAILLLFGVFGNMCNIAVNTQGVAVEKIYNKSIMASFHGAWSIAGFTGALIGLLTINLKVDTSTHFMIIFFMVFINMLLNRKFLVPGKTAEEKKKGLVKPDSMLIQLGVLGFLSMATEGAMFDWSGVYFKEVVKAPEQWVPVGYASFMIMMASGRFIGDFIIAKIGRQRALELSGILMCSGMMLSVFFPQFGICIVAFMMVGLGVACVVPTVYSEAGQHPKIAPGRALAMVSSISFLGFLMGPPLIGYIAEWLDLRFSYATFAVFGLMLTLLSRNMSIFRKS
ncbi:MAG: MFS transporter [Bacteroidetes bacterium 43-16]|nr:MAG: MFS transporter [Bacteroidetes bacterium 43-16]